MSRISHFLDNRFSDGGEVVSRTPPRKILWFSFLLDVKSTAGLEGLGKLKKKKTLLGLEPATFHFISTAPQPTTLLRASL
jgi:hypothetical protein